MWLGKQGMQTSLEFEGGWSRKISNLRSTQSTVWNQGKIKILSEILSLKSKVKRPLGILFGVCTYQIEGPRSSP